MRDPIQLEIEDSTGNLIDNQYWPSDRPDGWLAILLPGLRYNSDMPLMYFSRQLLRKRNVSTLNLNPDTHSQLFRNGNRDIQHKLLMDAVIAGIHAGRTVGGFRGLVLVGKSIGTLAVARAYPEIRSFLPTILIWLTPLLREESVFEAALNAEGPQVFICGGADPTFMNDRLNKIISERPRASAFVAPGANHSLELESDDRATFRGITEAMVFLGNFLDQNL